ncbi:alkylmercury lyase family protein [Streptomyces sp. Ag109_G2-15]|uniref:alkylmercury lyase family protein n=1 Tax=Streptomyces sp. Ag109_G2-15 TaxID=1938850 RepID=UPI000BD959EC|nr:alkylmercury lyase family protein [Streptomyces sp. Ag109_G2-15]SOE06621.1 Alkylmercury lyase [Streptomyces sp. Ag109_G2-15]
MHVEMLTVPDCPNGPVLRERLILALAGRTDVKLTEHVVDDQAEAERRGMHGSPTLLVDGHDPFAAPGTAASVSCRLYRGTDGRVGGAPSVAELRRVLGTPATGVANRAAGRSGQGRLAPIEGGLRAVQQAVLRSFATTGAPPGQAELEAAAEPFAVPAARVLAELATEDFLTLDDTGRIRAAYPFSATATEHVVQIADGPTVWSMCAIDALGIPVMLGADAVITSTDPVTGDPVRVEFTGGKTTWQPATAVVYYGTRPDTGPAAAVCCDYLSFFTDRATAEQATGQHADISGAVLDQTEAERLGADIFGPLLAAPAP